MSEQFVPQMQQQPKKQRRALPPVDYADFELSAGDDSFDEDEEDHDGDLDRTAKPLFEAILGGKSLSVLRSIVKRRPDSIRGLCDGESPLHRAVRCGSPLEHVKYLYELFPDAINDDTERCGRLPLHIAISITCTIMLSPWRKHFPDPCGTKTPKDRSRFRWCRV